MALCETSRDQEPDPARTQGLAEVSVLGECIIRLEVRSTAEALREEPTYGHNGMTSRASQVLDATYLTQPDALIVLTGAYCPPV